MEIKDRNLHRVTTTILAYKPDFTYLITKRGDHKPVHPGKWCIPGGGMTVDDYIHTPPSTPNGKQWYGAVSVSARRELQEETNIEVGELRLLTDLAFIRLDGIPVICFSYFGPYVSGEVVLDEDATEFAWVTLEEAKDYDLIQGVWDEMRQVHEILTSHLH